MTAAVRKERENGLGYRLFCMMVLFCGTLYRAVKKAMKGKCGKKLQGLFSVLAFGCLGAVIYLCACLEQDRLSLLSTVLLAIPCMAGFGLFCDFAGAFRPYRYMKKKGMHQNRRKNVMHMPTAQPQISALRKSA